jgi:hypothetical protein
LLILALVFLSLFALLSGRAAARVGVGVDVGSITVDQPVIPGSTTYVLPSIGVVNTGDATSSYRMRASLVASDDALRPDPSWFTFDPESALLQPGETVRISPRLTVSPEGEEGPYFLLLEAYPADDGPAGSDTPVKAAAATKLTFTVVRPEPGVGDGGWGLDRTILLGVGAVILAAALLSVLLRRYRLLLTIQRRGAPEDR